MTKYTVVARRSGQWWSLQCREVPGALSQVARLSQADHIREAIAYVADVDEDSVDFDLQVELPESLAAQLAAAEDLRNQAESARSAAACALRQAAAELADSGMTLRDIGRVLNISYQRAHQLVSEQRSQATRVA